MFSARVSDAQCKHVNTMCSAVLCAVASLGGGGRTAPGDTLQGGDTRRKKMCGQIYKE